MIRKRAFLHTYVWLLLIPCILGGFYVYATIDKTVYTTTELVVIPGQVTATDWQGVESVLVQDLGEYAVYQEFDSENAGYPIANSIDSSTDVLDVSLPDGGGFGNETGSADGDANEETSVSESGGDGNSNEAATVETPASAEAEESEASSADETQSNPEPAAEQSFLPPRSYDSGLGDYQGVLTQSVVAYPLAQVVAETPVVDTTQNDESATEEAETPTPVVDNGVVEEDIETVVQDPVTEVGDSEPQSDTVEDTAGAPSDQVGVTDETTAVEEVVVDEGLLSEPLLTAVPTSTITPCIVNEGCTSYSTTFDGFYLPEFESNQKLDGAQLRFSLAAKEKNGTDYMGPQRFRIEYSFDQVTYQTATVIDVDGEASNAINGGYYLVTFDSAPSVAQLSQLSVRVVYEGNLEAMEGVYVDGVWLQVTAGSFYEDVAATTTDDVLYERDLMQPKFLELTDQDIDYGVNTLPSFTMSYSPQQNFFMRMFTELFSDNHYDIQELRLTNANGDVTDVPIEVVYHDDTTWTLQFKKQPQKLVAGKYSLEVRVKENDVVYVDSFEFYWGVLAVNTTKSMYFPDEAVNLQLAALTDKGDTICNADLRLKIIDPQNTVFEIPVEQTGACGPNNVTDIPDYVANFAQTGEPGAYSVQLEHYNIDGKLVHAIRDSFEVREYIPYDITRSAPTRIYPPAPYTVTLDVKANRTFSGDIVERVPRGFVFVDTGGAEITTLPDVTLLTWKNVVMEEGETLRLTYVFDAPDLSPYMYLLGPLNMDGFEELRQWQIASDAISSAAWLTSTGTELGVNLNTITPAALVWGTSTLDRFYFEHSTTSFPGRVYVEKDGDFLVSVTLPLERNDTVNTERARVGFEVRVNGVVVPHGTGRSGLIYNILSGNRQNESSSHGNFLLTDLSEGDYIEVYAQALTTYVAQPITITGQASMYIEHIAGGAGVFAATATSTLASTSLNGTPSELTWTETRQDNGFIHSDSINPEEIIISQPGAYLVYANLPLESRGATPWKNVLGRVLLDGVQVPGGVMSQGIHTVTVNSDFYGSIHWSGVIVSTTTNQVLSISTEQEAAAGTTTVPAGYKGSVFVQKLPTEDLIAVRGRNLSGGTNWNVTPAQTVLFDTHLAYDSTVFTHSTTSNTDDIVVNESGDYLLVYNDALFINGGTNNVVVSVTVNGTKVVGAETKSHYVSNSSGHQDSSGSLVFNLENLSPGDVVNIQALREANTTVADDRADALVMLWKKRALNFRPEAPTFFNTPFDNARLASTTPVFEFQSYDPDGASDLQYEFALSTSSDFSNAIIRLSGTDAGFSNAASSSDLAPFTENNKIRFQLQPDDALTDLGTYYWRVRAIDVTGSAEYGEWSVTQSLTVNLAATVPNWYQSYTGQFNTNNLVGTVSSGDNKVQVDAGVNSEIMIAYGDSTITTPRYRLWTGSAWGAQLSALPVGGTINWVRTAAGVTRDEYVLVTLDQSNAAYAQVYTGGTTTAWGSQVLLSNVVNNRNHRGIAVGYESLSGDAMAVSCSNGAAPVYRIWNGVSWSATSSISVSSLNNCSFLEIASDPASDELLLVVRDSGASVGSNYEALVWNGSSWIANRVLGSVQAGQLDRAGIGLAYEASGQQAIIAVTNGTNANIAYTTWNGTTFTTNATQPIGNDFEFGVLAPDTDSDDMALCYVDEDTDAGVLLWNGGSWQTFQEVELTPNSNTGRPIDCNFETVAGRSNNLLISYSDTVNIRYQPYSGSWPVTEQTVTGIEDSFWVQTERAGDGTIVLVAHDDAVAGDEIESSYWNGTSWSTKQQVVANPSSVIGAPYETYSMSAKRFQFTQGVVTTAPISFSFVPNRTTWGDLSFSTTEPFGTNVVVKLKYSSSTACDTYIPNSALSGNAAGFDVASSTVNLSGLSTTTYSQICLEATITTLGSESASLDDWSVTWLREPKLIQNNYRWYANGSFLTPTDPWPVGVTDLLENTPMGSTEAVNINDVVRLRMSLQGSNVNLASSTELFKLQYAAGQTCSPLLAWADVGGPASTTAVWRGYQNAIIGSDWLSAAWTRRLKLSVEGTLVTGAQTDFPVYVNLDDLPDSFFANVQSDGDDIRITSSNGLSEVPFELVSINTTTKKGELHFKGNLASTTDTDFYIYYGNPSASGYAVTAPFGRNNVWTNGFEAVYHLETSPASNMTDSTSNGRTLTTNGSMLGSQSTTSVMGNGVDFDGINDRLTNAAWSWQNTANAVTVTAWNNVTTAETKVANLFGFTVSGNERLATHAPWSDASIYWDFGTCCGVGGRVNTSYAAYRNKWTHIGLVSRGSTTPGFMGIYLDGTAVATSSSSDDPNVTLTGFSLGSDLTTGGNHHDGRIDEFRIASVERSAGWLRTERTNQSNPTGFYYLSAEELIGDGTLLASPILTGSDYVETYEENNPTSLNRNMIAVGNDAEWDFVLQNNNGVPNTEYCFRMVYDDGATLNTYSRYPQLITNSPPPAPTLLAPFDNEQSASTTPWFEFFTDDELSDEVSYEVQIDNNYDFSSVTIGRESNANFSQFTNLSAPSERGLYTTGNTIQFIPNTTLSNGTYYWRVRAKDDNGSGAYGEWSTPYSFTVASTSITTWFQTTGEQFATDNLLDAQVSTSTNDVGILTSFTTATITSTAIDYDDKDTGNAWGRFSFTHNVTSGSITYYIEYNTGGDVWALIPNADLAGNATGFTSSPVSLIGLDTETYNEIRIVGVLVGSPTLPRLLDWKVEWGETIDVPTASQPFDNAKVNTTLPQFTFLTTDPQNSDLQYELQLSSSYNFTSSSTFLSGVSAGFVNVTNGADTSPFTSGNTIRYTAQSGLSNGATYWWRVRAKDPGDTDIWSDYSEPQSFTIDTAAVASTWFQTTGEQFATNDLVNVEAPSGGAQISSVISEVMSVYGEGAGQSPQYRLWNGSVWSAPESAESVDAQIRWTRLKAAPTRPEYALGTLGTDLDINVQIYNGVTESWGNMTELFTESAEATKRRFDVEYETSSGDLMAVACAGSDAVYSVWNGTSWSATSTLDLANTNPCEWVQLSADPVSNEMIALFRHTNSSTTDYQALVWNGSSWGNSTTFGDISNNTFEGMSVNYEDSGGQALAITSNNANNSFLWSAWNGSSWTTATATAVGNDFWWSSLKRDVGTDRMVLCYVDADSDIGVLLWSGSSWNTFSEIDQNNNDINGRGVDCEFQTTQGTDGDIVFSYSDGTLSRYQVYSYASSSFTVEADLSTMNDGFYMQSVRGGDGNIHTYTLDDASNPDRYDTSYFNGTTWSTLSNFSINPSITASPYNGSIAMAAQIFPNFTEGSIRSTPIEFTAGGSPRWERVRWNDSTPGGSDIKYRVYYQTATGTYALIPDSVLSGNAAGFTNSPVSIAAVDRTIYSTLKLDAELVCAGGTCPSLQDWSVEWSEGITISGSAFGYDQVTAIATGTIGVAINGVLQVGKTATLGSGTTTQEVVFDTAGTSTFTVPAGVTNVTIKAWGAGGGAGGGGTSDAGGAGGGAGFVQGNFTVIPAENLSIRVGGGGAGGSLGLPPGAGGGGGYSGVLRSSTPLAIAGVGVGGGGGTGGIRYVGVGTACAVNATTCSPTIPASTENNDVYIAVLHTRTNTAHTCVTNCTGWTEFSSQAGSAGEGRLSVWWYRQSGAAPGNPTFGGPAGAESYTGRIWAYRGVTTSGNPYDVLGTNTAITVATTTFAGSSLTSSVADAMVVHVAGSMDDNTWGPGSGSCNTPNGVNTNFYTANLNGTDNSIALCYKDSPLGAAGSLGVPVNTQVGNSPDVGRYFTFALKPNSSGIVTAGRGGVGGGLSGGAGVNASTTVAGGGGTQSAGGTAGGGAATIGSAYAGGDGNSGTGGGAGGAGGLNGGGAGGTGNLGTMAAAGGGGGAGYYGGGGANSASGVYISGAGGGGGSSFIETGATATSTISGSTTQAGNNLDSSYVSGVGVGNTSATSSNGGAGGNGRVVISWSTANTPGAWTISNVSAFAGDVITVFMQGASGTAEAVGVTKYDGVGDISGMQLSQRHLTIGSADAPVVTNANIGLYDSSDTEDVFFSVTGANVLNLCVESTCSDARLRVLASSTYQPAAAGTVINFQNNGTFAPATNTLRVSGQWMQMATFTPETSTIIFTATTSSWTLQNATTSYFFHNVTFGETSGSATWNLTKPLDITGTLGIDFGTLARGTTSFNMEQGLRIGSGGFITGLGTTTFDGSGSHTWTDTTASSTNVGNVVIDGAAKTITLGGNVSAQSVTIGSDDTFNASGSGYNITVFGNWTNNNAFIPQSGTVTFVGTTTSTIVRGTSAFNNLTFNGVGGSWSFSTSTLALNGNFTIATGSVTLPTGTTTIGGSFINSGGTFLHNNGEVRMTSTAGGRTITQRAGIFNNAFYDLVFSGSGAWSYTESAATTTRNMNILAGTVTLASSTLTVGGDFSVSGSGAFAHNNGELVLLVQASNVLRTNGSVLNNLRTRGNSGSWYNSGWGKRLGVTVQSSRVPTTVTDFPVYLNLASLPDSFFASVKPDGGDIRMTTADGMTEIPVEVVAINTIAKTGELHFRAPTLSSTTNTSFYVYYGNSSAATNTATSTFGRANVWSNGYEAVYHLQTNPAATIVDSTAYGRNLTSVGGMGAGNSVAAQMGNGIDFDGLNDYLTNASFAWPNASNTITVTAWNNVTTAETKNANLFGFTESGGQRVATHGPWGDAVLYWDFGAAGVPGRVSTSYAAYRDKWTHIGLTSPGAGGGNMSIYLDGTVIANSTASDPSATLTGFSLGSLGASQYHDGRIDEFRIASVVRTGGWIATERNNQASSSAFYVVTGEELLQRRIFTDTNATILGNVVLETGGDTTFPSGTLSVGGSFDNDAIFSANNGTVRFNSTAGAETIAVGTTSSFATVDFSSVTGDFTVTESATATVAFNLTNAAQFTVQSGRTIAALGTFTNAATASSTTWTGSTLVLANGSTMTLNSKAHAGDTYGTLRATSTLVQMWNSSANTYETFGTTGAIYSQDHAGVDGDLNIYGNYTRTSGTEFWSFGTDFDGTVLTGSTSRQVDVRVASSSRVGFVGATLNLVGSALASSTLNAVSGAFGLSATNTTIVAEHFTVGGTDSVGWALRASTTLSTFRDGFFTVVPGRAGITISSSTVTHNPSAQFFRIGFATTTAGLGTNVAISGTSSAFVWFRTGGGNLYGEAYDGGGDANPGSIRFDDSSNSITISGVVYSNDGTTPQGAPTCNGTTPNVRIMVDGAAGYTASTTCAAGTGAYSFTNVQYVGDPKIIVYLNTNGGVSGSVVTKTPTSNITNMHIYANRVITRHQDTAPLTAADMQLFDFDNDTDIKFLAATTSLTVLPNTELFVFASTTFAPGGNVTILGNASSTGHDGTLQIGSGATFTASGTETHTLGGRLVIRSAGVFTPASSTVLFNATTTGKSVTASSTITFNDVQFTGVGGAWNLGANLLVLGSMQVATGTVTGTTDITIPNGSLTGNGTLSLGSFGTVALGRTSTLGGTRAWTFNNLTLGNGSVTGTTTMASTATTSVGGVLTISNAHFLDALNSRFDLTGSSTVFVETGTLLEGTSYFRYSGAASNVLSTGYYDLDLNAGVGLATYTATGIGINVLNSLSVGGTATSTFNVTTNDPSLTVVGDVLVRANGVLVGSNSAAFTVGRNWTNLGTFTHSSGTVTFNGAASSTIAAGNSTFAGVTINGTGNFTMSQNATATGAFVLTNHSNFTVSSGRSLALGGTFTNTLGGGATTFTGSTLHFYGGGSRVINASTTNDSYGTLSVAAGTNVRMWNSSASAYLATGGIYSQDHAGTDGLLNIYGAFTSDSASDHWSYGTDFDGTTLTSSSSRAVTVAFASGASARYTGGALSVLGTTSATTSLQNQGSGTYGFAIEGGTVNWNRVQIRDVNGSGIVFAGAPVVTDFSRTDHLIKINSATAVTVGGSVINANEAKNFTNNIFTADIGVIGATNVTATGTAVSSWRFTNHTGNVAGEGFDVDPAGDPGYLVWDDSAALVTISGNVYSDEGSTVSSVCNGSTTNIRLVVAGLTTYDASCNASTGAYSISNVAFSPLDTLTLYINGETPKAANVSTEPLSSISSMHLYENRVIVRHENTNPLTIAKMAVWDSSDDADVPFTAVDAGTDTLLLPANRKLLIWTGKTFAPGGDVTLSGGGGGAAFDGTLEALPNATFRAAGTESHSVGGSMIFGTGAVFVSGQSTTTFTTSGSARTVDVNGFAFHNAAFTGSGSWNITDATTTFAGSYSQSNGVVTFPTGTTTVGRSFTVTGGTFSMTNSPLYFIATSTGNQVRFNGSTVPALRFNGAGGAWAMTDTNATTTGGFRIDAGTVTLPSGNFAVGRSFENLGGSIAHNTADLIMTATSSATLTASGSDLFAVAFTGPGPFTITGPNVTYLDSFSILNGSVTMATGTTAIGGSFTATGGTFTHSSGTVLFNATAAGKTINPGSSSFYSLQIGAPSGSYTMSSATTTNNFTLASATGFTLSSGSTLRVGGVFTNSVGGAATTWTGSTLSLVSGGSYSINTRVNSGDLYGTLAVGANTHVRSWYSSAATTTVNAAGSLYSQDNNNVNGHLYIYGNLTLGTSTEYWNYATDFDGTALGGSPRKVSVFMGTNATTTLTSGTLQLLGASSSVTSVEALNSSTTYSFIVNGGTFTAGHYSFAGLGVRGLQLSGISTITDLSNGYFNLAVTGQPLITLESTTLNANPSKVFDSVGFNATNPLTGYNVELVGSSSNAWRFTNNYGNIGGEANDIDGIDACGSIRFSNSSCLLTEQTHVRWRLNNGGEGVPTSEWFDGSWNYRKRVRFDNTVNESAATTTLKMTVAYDSDMQTDFDDLRFTGADGLTVLPHWIERYTASTDAVVWVRVPSVAANDITTVFMYYGNGTASSTSAATSTFTTIDTFDDNNITEYSGDSSLFKTDTSPVYGGTHALEANNQNGRTTDGIFRSDLTVSQGQLIRWMQYIDTTGSGDEACTLFGVQSPGTNNNNYAVCLEQFGTDRIALSKNVSDNDVSGTVLATSSVTFTTGWYEVEVDWKTNNNITASLYTAGGTLVTSVSATDASYTTGGIGFSFWFQKGAWDSYLARPRGAGRPTVYFGAEQVPGGASWAAAQDAPGNGYATGDVARLRIAVENSGLNITAQEFRLEYAAKGVAPTCESVAAVNYVTVPNQASCGSSPVCMATSSNVTNGAPTTDQLFSTNGDYRPGEVVTSPSNQTTAFDVNQDSYTELEYVITPTVNASDEYCFRVTDGGDALDFYNEIAELGLRFDPSVSAGAFNQGFNIALTPGTTTLVVATTSVFDFNGYADLAHATATFYRTAVGASCTPDNNNCYRGTTAGGQCAFINCSDSRCELRCTAQMAFHADATDFGVYDGQEWFAFFEVEDQQDGYGFNSSPGVEVQTMRAITVDSSINYGSLEVNSDTGSYNPTTTVTNLGNIPVNIEIEGSDLSDGNSSRVPAAQQKFATSTFTYSSCVTCNQLSSSTPVAVGLNLSKPAVVVPPVAADVYWGIAVPFGINSVPHTGINIFTPIDI